MKKIFSHRKAFSLVELFITMVIIAIFTSFVTSNIASQSQTAKQEAERLAAYFTDLMRKADRRHVSFTINFSSLKNVKNVYVFWGSDKTNPTYICKENPGTNDEVIMTPGFSISEKSFTGSASIYETPNEVTYSSSSNRFLSNGSLTIKRDIDNSEYYLVFREGRIRASETKGDQ